MPWGVRSGSACGEVSRQCGEPRRRRVEGHDAGTAVATLGWPSLWSSAVRPKSGAGSPGSVSRPGRSSLPSSRVKRNRPGSCPESGSEHSTTSSCRTVGRRFARAPTIPVIGETRTLRTRSWIQEGRSPVDSIGQKRAAGNRSPSAGGPQSPMSAPVVECTSPSPNIALAPSSRASDAVGSEPRGSCARTESPSSAGHGRSPPGHISASSRRVTWREARVCDEVALIVIPPRTLRASP